MAKVQFKRVESVNDLDSIPIEDGNFIVTGDGKTYVDYGTERKGIGGTPDNKISDTSTNSVENKVVKKYVDDTSSKHNSTGKIDVIAEEESTTFSAHEIDINKYNAFVLQNKIKENNVIESSLFISVEQLISSSEDLIYECSWSKGPENYCSFIYYKDNKVYLKNQTSFSSAILLGIKGVES